MRNTIQEKHEKKLSKKEKSIKKKLDFAPLLNLILNRAAPSLGLKKNSKNRGDNDSSSDEEYKTKKKDG